MKGKFSLAVIMGFTAFILTMVMFTQFKTVDETDITAIETMRETELRTELSKLKESYEDIEAKLQETENKINEYEEKKESEEDSAKLLEKELNEAKAYLGYTNVHGEGIVITLSDSSSESIESYDLISLVNELKLAGAEAISINDNRIVSISEIVDINYKYILVNGKRISGPYSIKAIGNQKYLESALTFKNGYIDEMDANGKNVLYSLEDDVHINAYDGEIEINYSKVEE